MEEVLLAFSKLTFEYLGVDFAVAIKHNKVPSRIIQNGSIIVLI